jgi:hypothetical protein
MRCSTVIRGKICVILRNDVPNVTFGRKYNILIPTRPFDENIKLFAGVRVLLHSGSRYRAFTVTASISIQSRGTGTRF